MFFEILALTWILSGCANIGIRVAMSREAGMKPSASELVAPIAGGPLCLAFNLTELWLARQKCLEEIATNLTEEE